jgi:hypothetical protein
MDREKYLKTDKRGYVKTLKNIKTSILENQE